MTMTIQPAVADAIIMFMALVPFLLLWRFLSKPVRKSQDLIEVKLSLIFWVLAVLGAVSISASKKTVTESSSQPIMVKADGKADYTAIDYGDYKNYNLKFTDGTVKTVKHVKTAYAENQEIKPVLKTIKTHTQSSLLSITINYKDTTSTQEVHLNANDR